MRRSRVLPCTCICTILVTRTPTLKPREDRGREGVKRGDWLRGYLTVLDLLFPRVRHREAFPRTTAKAPTYFMGTLGKLFLGVVGRRPSYRWRRASAKATEETLFIRDSKRGPHDLIFVPKNPPSRSALHFLTANLANPARPLEIRQTQTKNK